MEYADVVEKIKSDVLREKLSNISNDDAVYELARQMSSIKTMTFTQFKEIALTAPDSLKKYFNPKYFITPIINENHAIDCEDFLR